MSEEKKVRKVGRPRLDVNDLFEDLKPFLQVGYSLYKACILADIPYVTVYRRYNEDEDFRRKVDRERNMVNVLARQIIIEKMQEERDPKLAMEWLDRMEKDEFSKKVEIAVSSGEKKRKNAKELLFELFQKEKEKLAKGEVGEKV